MKNFKVMLTRNYIIDISAINQEEAMFLSEFFISNVRDDSNEKEQNQFKFKINDIEMTFNEAFEAEEIDESK